MTKVVINACYGRFRLSKAALAELQITDSDADGMRDDPRLIACVEKLGADVASGNFAYLKIVEIPDDVCWEIKEHDGNEWVTEVHRTWR